MDKKKLIIVVCDRAVTSGMHNVCLASLAAHATNLPYRLLTLESHADAFEKLNDACNDVMPELSLEPEHDFTVSYKDYLSRRKNKRAMYKRR